jgi:hypothetical protein
VALITPLIHVRGYAAPETKAAIERARLLIEQAEAERQGGIVARMIGHAVMGKRAPRNGMQDRDIDRR